MRDFDFHKRRFAKKNLDSLAKVFDFLISIVYNMKR